jgi:hypothetical protein
MDGRSGYDPTIGPPLGHAVEGDDRAPIEFPLVLDAACPVLYPVRETTPEYFYGCGLHAAWRLDPLSLWSAAQDGPATQQLAEILQAVIAIAGALWLRLGTRESLRSDPSSGSGGSVFETSASAPDPVQAVTR